MDPGTKDVLGATVPVRRTVLLAVVGAVKNVGLVTALGKSVVPVVTVQAMICGTTNVHGVGVPAIRTVRHVPERDMTNVSLAMGPDKRTVHGAGGAVTKTVITATAQAR